MSFAPSSSRTTASDAVDSSALATAKLSLSLQRVMLPGDSRKAASSLVLSSSKKGEDVSTAVAALCSMSPSELRANSDVSGFIKSPVAANRKSSAGGSLSASASFEKGGLEGGGSRSLLRKGGPGSSGSGMYKSAFLRSVASPLDVLPASLRRRKPSDDIWCELSRVDAEVAKAAASLDRAAAVRTREALKASLARQLEEREQAHAAERAAEDAYAAQLQRAREEDAAAAKLAAERHEVAKAQAQQAQVRYNADQAERRAALKAAEIKVAGEAIGRLKLADEKERARLAVLAAEGKAAQAAAAAANTQQQLEKKAALKRQREEENAMIAAAIAAADEKERKRAADIAAREADQKKRLDAMSEVYAAASNADAIAQEKAEKERIAYWAKIDRANVEMKEQQAKGLATIGKSVRGQLRERALAEKERAKLIVVETERMSKLVAEHRLEEDRKKRALEEKEAAHLAAIQRAILERAQADAARDETATERAENEAYIRAVQAKVSAVLTTTASPSPQKVGKQDALNRFPHLALSAASGVFVPSSKR